MNPMFPTYSKIKGITFLLLLVLFLSMASGTTALAATPLITDDTGTQGRGKFQIELCGGYGHQIGPNRTSLSEAALHGGFGCIYLMDT
jgi:hypothetical protein